MRSLWALCVSLIVVLAAASGAAAAPSIIEFPLPATGGIPTDLATGGDGNLWVSREGAINRVTLGGFATQFPLADANAFAEGITAGPDGRLWFAEFFKFNEFGRIGLDGTFSMVPFAVQGQLQDFALGPDGNMWAAVPFGGTPRVTKFSPSGVVLADFPSGPERLPRHIVSGPGGALWLTESRDTQKFPDRRPPRRAWRYAARVPRPCATRSRRPGRRRCGSSAPARAGASAARAASRRRPGVRGAGARATRSPAR